MPANTLHPQHEASLSKWLRCRTVCAGEDAVKAEKTAHLPKLDEQDDTEYEAYLQRAQFFNASGRTLNSLTGLVFRTDPQVEAPATFKDFLNDATLSGQSFYDYQKELVKDVITTGRGGTLIDWSEEEKRPYFAFYKAEQILNWRTQRIGGRMKVSLIALHENVFAGDTEEGLPVEAKASEDEFEPEIQEQIRVLRLLAEGDSYGYIVEIYRKVKEEDGKTEKWELQNTRSPERRGTALTEIPFVFHGPNNSKPDVDAPPLDDLACVNLSHYRSSADLEHGRHFTALPTAWASGFDPKARLCIGSTTAWVTDQSNARAAFLEFTGQGLGALERALAHKEHQMAVLGARLLEEHKKAVEAASAMKIKQTGESATLKTIATSLTESLSMALRWAAFLMSPKDVALDTLTDTVKVELNTNYSEERMTAQEITALVGAWQAGALSKDSMLFNFKQGDLLNPSRTPEEEASLIEEEDGKRAMSILPGALPPEVKAPAKPVAKSKPTKLPVTKP